MVDSKRRADGGPEGSNINKQKPRLDSLTKIQEQDQEADPNVPGDNSKKTHSPRPNSCQTIFHYL